MKDMKNIFNSLQIPEPSADLEGKIMARISAAKPPISFAKYALAACAVVIMLGVGLYSPSQPATDFSAIIDVVDEDDVYTDLI